MSQTHPTTQRRNRPNDSTDEKDEPDEKDEIDEVDPPIILPQDKGIDQNQDPLLEL